MGNIGINEILRKLNVSSLTAMQQTTIEEYRKGTDLVLLSPTGSGKTLAYLIPLVQSLPRTKSCRLWCCAFARIGPADRTSLQIDGFGHSGYELLRGAGRPWTNTAR